MKAKHTSKKKNKKIQEAPRKKSLRKFPKLKRAKVLFVDSKNRLNKIEEIYKNYLGKYSILSQKRETLFNSLVENMKQRKIEILKKNIND